jgi:ABC-type transport system substrate-binding protein
VARRRLTVALFAAAVVVAACAAACRRGDDGGAGNAGPSTSGGAGTSVVAPNGDQPAVEDPIGSFEKGGTVRVAVWGAPDPAAPTTGGSAVRSLVLPQLFFAKPDGRWGPFLVEPGSDRASDDYRSASFRIRPGAAWSDGTAIGVDDLRRSADARFVEAVDGPADDGTITLRFTQPLPGWRRLWSANESIPAPRPGVWGGPFQVAGSTPGLETVLRPNPGWRGQGPFLEEIRLVLVPEATMARQLLARGDVDVIAPPAETQRTIRLQRTPGVSVHSTIADGGWWVGLLTNQERLDGETRRAVSATVDRHRFVSVLLENEALPLEGFGGVQDTTWANAGWAEPDAADHVKSLGGKTVDLVGQVEEPMTTLLHRSIQKRARDVGGRFELRSAEADRVESWLEERDYDAAVVLLYDAPSMCWLCRWGDVDEGLARAADGGDLNAVGALEAKLATEHLVTPLWRPRSVVAWRTGVVAPLRANPFGLSAAWDAWRWHTP